MLLRGNYRLRGTASHRRQSRTYEMRSATDYEFNCRTVELNEQALWSNAPQPGRCAKISRPVERVRLAAGSAASTPSPKIHTEPALAA